MLQLLNLVPRWVYAAAIAMLAATSCKLTWENGQLTIEIEKGKTHVASLESSIAQSREEAAEQFAANVQRARDAEAAAKQRQQRLEADAAGAHDELDRLRLAVSSYTAPRLTASPAAIAPGLDAADPIPELFVQCASRYVDLARAADGHVNDIQTLMQAWPKGADDK